MKEVSLYTEQLLVPVLKRVQRSKTIYILTAFAMKSGVSLLKKALAEAAEGGADVKLLAGDYLYVTQPEALYELASIHESIEVRLWRSNGISFHPKAYLFEAEGEEYSIIGSSNLSRSALTTGVEWSVGISDKFLFEEASSHFISLFQAANTIPVNKETAKRYEEDYKNFHQKHPNLARTWTKQEEQELMLPAEEEDAVTDPAVMEKAEVYSALSPRFAQLEALEQLDITLEEGYKKAMVVMATGLGKTYLAGFFAKKFKKVLFIAHLEEILHQSAASFLNVMPEKTAGIYNGRQKDSEAELLFASIQTLSMKRHLEVFQTDEFDLIVVDEFHHAAAASYQKVLDYFQPSFLLGITATPDRADNRDVYAICEGNVAYSIDFLEAIQRTWLSPFDYYGVYDETDYSKITWHGTQYDKQELMLAQLRTEQAAHILGAWEKHKKTRTIVFCSSIRQADFLSSYFQENGYRTISLHSKQKQSNRRAAAAALAAGELDTIFVVDLFNEGVDIPSVDTLLFVRPTESLTIFTQQIGRGLRLHPGKEQCVIIDLIGNYRNADIKLSLFDTNVPSGQKERIVEPVVPEACSIDLDIRVINLLKEMTKKRQPRKEKLLANYRTVKEELGRRPTYLELHLKGEISAAEYKNETYYGFLHQAGELTADEEHAYLAHKDWLADVVKTDMKKSYKMIVLLAMLERGPDNWFKTISATEIATFFHDYLMSKEHRKRIDFSDKQSEKLWDYNESDMAGLIERMPMTKWSGSSKGFAVFEDKKFYFNVSPVNSSILYNWTREICEYRLHQYFEKKGALMS
ncbi:DEAD/DEAH box helicase family protein [Metabacillus sp. GX 13764]|uniref:DEAD/DEAH box helicase family protein n=1 Tax=Metabacillus kandeliae TaxID=2900151 RepID=UPI001E5F66A4|nr:DEAD/DEAH box helicase family protein [Metabacillus kandeliae]MCD7034141.1 DEAD/DEAH box helicase family protein [Metabacillus kandeliae]